MDYDSIRGSPLHVRASLTAAGSVEIFSSATGTRWNLIGGFVGWANISAGANLRIMEQSTDIVRFAFQTTGGNARIDFRRSWPASSSNTSLRLNTDAAGSMTAMFYGTRTGVET